MQLYSYGPVQTYVKANFIFVDFYLNMRPSILFMALLMLLLYKQTLLVNENVNICLEDNFESDIHNSYLFDRFY